MVSQLRELESKLDLERKTRVNAASSKKEVEIAPTEYQLVSANVELNQEQKARVNAANSKRKMEVDVADLEMQTDTVETELDEVVKARVNAANSKRKIEIDMTDPLERQLKVGKGELDEECKARVNAANLKKNIEVALLEKQLKVDNRFREDGLRQLRKYKQQLSYIQRDLDETGHLRNETSHHGKENEMKAKMVKAKNWQIKKVREGFRGDWVKEIGIRGFHVIN